LDPAPIWFLPVPWGAGFGFVCWKVGLTEQHTRIGLPVLLSVRPSSRQVRRTAPPDINGVNALAFGTLFSSQGASADPKEGTPRRWGRATHHGRHASRGRQPNSCPDPALLRFAPRIPAAAALERSFGPTMARSRSGGSVRRRYRFETRMEIAAFPALPRVPLPGSRSPPL